MAGFEYLKKFFQSENFRYEEEEGILSFKIQGVNYFAFTNDSPFLQIVIVVIFPIRIRLRFWKYVMNWTLISLSQNLFFVVNVYGVAMNLTLLSIPLLTNLWLFLVFSTRHQMSSLKNEQALKTYECVSFPAHTH